MLSSKTFTKKYSKKLSWRAIVLLGMVIGALLLILFIIHEVFWDKEIELDNSILNFIANNVVSDGLTPFMRTITYMASSTFMQIGYTALALIYIISKNWKRALEIAIIGLGGFAIKYVMKISFKRLRPPDPLIDRLENFSFPSGHATSAFIFYGLLTYLVWKTTIPKVYRILAGVVFISLALLIGFSRLYLRVHYPSDVVAGFCIGFTWLFLTIWMFNRLKKQSDEELRYQREEK